MCCSRGLLESSTEDFTNYVRPCRALACRKSPLAPRNTLREICRHSTDLASRSLNCRHLTSHASMKQFWICEMRPRKPRVRYFLGLRDELRICVIFEKQPEVLICPTYKFARFHGKISDSHMYVCTENHPYLRAPNKL